MTADRGPVLVWMRGSLRVRDNALLAQAAQAGGDVVPFLCGSDGWSGTGDTPRRRMLRASITALNESLRAGGSALFMLGEDPLREIPRAASALGAKKLFVARSADAHRRRDDRRLTRALDDIGCAVCEIDDATVFGGDPLRTSSGSPYLVYTPYRNAWLSRIQEAIPPAPPVISPLPRMPSLRACETLEGYRSSVDGGEPLALRMLGELTRNGLHAYHLKRDTPGADATSRLSPHIATGAISVRTVLSAVRRARRAPAARGGDGAGVFINELIWREFFRQIMEHSPRVAEEPYREEFSAFPWHSGKRTFPAWCGGNTGYPIVDAGMRQLAAEGWMHNRVRMIVASFLTKDIHVDPRRGEAYFFDLLADADRASNNGNWQWVAGTGTDASPYFRIFNPVLQGKKFDPQGTYVRTYVPELARIPDAFIHAPWEMGPALEKGASYRPGKDYPRPIVNHAEERETALRMFRAARGGRPAGRKSSSSSARE